MNGENTGKAKFFMFPTTVGCLEGSFQFDVFQNAAFFLPILRRKSIKWIVFDEFWVVTSSIKNLIDR